MTEWYSGQYVGLITQRSEVRILVQSFFFLKFEDLVELDSVQGSTRREEEMSFIQYYVEYFEDDAEMFWFPQFKRLAREMFKLMNTSDLDYEAAKKTCQAQDMYEVAEICYRHNETYFREEVMDWVELAQTGRRGIRVAPKGKDIHFLRNRVYYVAE